MTYISSHQLLYAQARQKDLLREAQNEQLFRNVIKVQKRQRSGQPTTRFYRTWQRLVAGAAMGSALFLTACRAFHRA